MKVYQINNEVASNMPAGKETSFQNGYHIFALKWLLLVLLAVGCVVFSISRDPPPKSHYSALCVPRFEHKALTLSDGRVLAVGGTPDSARMLSSAEMYDPENRFWRRVADMPEPMFPEYMWQLNDGRVLVYGHVRFGRTLMDQVFLYDIQADRWLAASPMKAGEQGWLEGAVYQQQRPLLIAEARARPEQRVYFGSTAVLMAGDKLLVSGGILRNTDNHHSKSSENSAFILDIAQAQWQETLPMHDARRAHTLTLLADGRVLAAGGSTSYPDDTLLHSVEVFDPSTGAWQQVASMHGTHADTQALLLPDGRVVVTGNNSGAVKIRVGNSEIEGRKWQWQGVMEVYDTANDRWEQVVSGFRQIDYILLLADGRVAALQDGGFGTPRIMLWNPLSHKWSDILSGYHQRSRFVMTQLGDNHLMLTGGQIHVTRSERGFFEPVDTVDFLNLPPI